MRKGRDGEKREKNVIASSRPPERRPLERHTLAPIKYQYVQSGKQLTINAYLGRHQMTVHAGFNINEEKG